MTVYEKLDALHIVSSTTDAAGGGFCALSAHRQFAFLVWSYRQERRPALGRPARGESHDGTGKRAARAVAIDLLGTLHAAAGDLNKIKRMVKLMVLVNSTSTFTEQHLVANGASELFEQVFGDMGRHVRSAFGVAQVPVWILRRNRPDR
jgi:hypothetical protein